MLYHPKYDMLNFRDERVRLAYERACKCSQKDFVDGLFMKTPKFFREEVVLDEHWLNEIIEALERYPTDEIARQQPRIISYLNELHEYNYLKDAGFQVFMHLQMGEVLDFFQRELTDECIKALRLGYYHVKELSFSLALNDTCEGIRKGLFPGQKRIFPRKQRKNFSTCTFPDDKEWPVTLFKLTPINSLNRLSEALRREVYASKNIYYVVGNEDKGLVFYTEYFKPLAEFGDTKEIRRAFADQEGAQILAELA